MVTNGNLPADWLVPVPGYNLQLRPEALAAWTATKNEVTATYGWTPTLTAAYRPYDQQVQLFTARYRIISGNGPYGDVRDWNGARYVRISSAGAVAIPGTSNHGWGVAIDVGNGVQEAGTRWDQWNAVAPRHGWSWAEGRSINERWHWTLPSVTKVLAPVITTPTAPNIPLPTTPLVTRDWFDMASVDDLRTVVQQEIAKVVPLLRHVVLAEVTGVEPDKKAHWYVVDYGGRTYQPLGPDRLALAQKQGLSEYTGQGSLFLEGFTRIPG